MTGYLYVFLAGILIALVLAFTCYCHCTNRPMCCGLNYLSSMFSCFGCGSKPKPSRDGVIAQWLQTQNRKKKTPAMTIGQLVSLSSSKRKKSKSRSKSKSSKRKHKRKSSHSSKSTTTKGSTGSRSKSRTDKSRKSSKKSKAK